MRKGVAILLIAGVSGCGTKGTSISPSIPTASPVTPTSTGEVQLTWNATANATGYSVEESTNNVTYAQAQTVAAPTVTTTISGLTGGQVYYFRVQAYNTGGDSGYSNVASIVP